MKRTKTQLLQTARDFFEEIRKTHPETELAEVFPERYAGADMWIALGVPSELAEEVLEKAVKLTSKWTVEKGISILVTIRKPSNPVHV